MTTPNVEIKATIVESNQQEESLDYFQMIVFLMSALNNVPPAVVRVSVTYPFPNVTRVSVSVGTGPDIAIGDGGDQETAARLLLLDLSNKASIHVEKIRSTLAEIGRRMRDDGA